MHMIFNRYAASLVYIVAVMSVIFVFPSGGFSDEPSRELLLFIEIPEISTSTKYPQSIMESPNSVSVISEEDIRLSGATNIPDLLRMVPGIHVMATSASEFNVSSRGGKKISG